MAEEVIEIPIEGEEYEEYGDEEEEGEEEGEEEEGEEVMEGYTGLSLDEMSFEEIAAQYEEIIEKNDLIEEESYVMQQFLKKHLYVGDFEKPKAEHIPPLNLDKRIEVVNELIDDLRKLRSNLDSQHEIEIQKIRAKNEQFSIEKKHLIKSEEEFNKNIVSSAISPRTGKVLSERVEKYFSTCLLQKENEINKLVSRNLKLQRLIRKLSKRLKRNTTMNEKLSQIDFDQLKIENDQMKEKEKNLNRDIISLKSSTGKTQQILTSLMEKLNQLQGNQKKLNNLIRDREGKLSDLDIKIQKEEKLKKQHERKNRHLTKYHEELRVPEVLQYVKVKSDLYDLRNEVKSWERKVTIAKMNENLYSVKLKHAKILQGPSQGRIRQGT